MLTRLLLPASLCLVLVFSGCASSRPAPARSPASFRAIADPSPADPRNLEYQALREDIASLHVSSMFAESDPRIFSPSVIDAYPRQFAQANCAGLSPERCQSRFSSFVMRKLSERYFAADLNQVQATCAREPIICGDLNTLETLFRRLHNSGILESEQEKLGMIKQWRDGKLSDDQLKSALHVDFKLQDGKVVLSLPHA